MAKIPLFIKGDNGKSCEGCTKCCEGYLSANILGEEMYPGKACRFVLKGEGCSIYEDRPKDPCRGFQCFWRASEIMPMEFKPSEVGVIVSNQEIFGVPYLRLDEAGNEVPADVLSWFVTWAVGNQLNVSWTVKDKTHTMGSSDFHQAMARRADMERQQAEK